MSTKFWTHRLSEVAQKLNIEEGAITKLPNTIGNGQLTWPSITNQAVVTLPDGSEIRIYNPNDPYGWRTLADVSAYYTE